MSNDKETLQELVIQEAKRLKKNATPEELENLDFENLEPDSDSKCIYGQMTGNCFSKRANELILKCASRVYVENKEAGWYGLSSYGLSRDAKLNGKPYPVQGSKRAGEYFSPIERFVYLSGNKLKTKKLIDYLKNKIKVLEF